MFFGLSQGGSAGDDEFRAIAGSPDDTVVFAGYTMGDWSATNVGAQDFAAVAAFASFAETPATAPPTITTDEGSEPEPESETSGERSIWIRFSIVLSMIALIGFLVCRARKTLRERNARLPNGDTENRSPTSRRRRSAIELDAFARARRVARDVGSDDDASPVTRSGARDIQGVGGGAVLVLEADAGSGEVEHDGGGAVHAQEDDIPYAHAVAVPRTSDVDGSGRAWTVVAAELVER